MTDAINRVLEPFLAAADGALGAGYSALLYGSAARGDFVEGRSNVNLMLILDDASPKVLGALGPAFAAWRKLQPEPPLLLSRAEWGRATDVFPLEIADMRTAYRVVRGADPLAGLEVDARDLRRALERELRGKLLRLRQGYVTLSRDAEALTSMVVASLPTVLVLLRGVLALVERHVPHDPAHVATEAAAAVGFPAEAVAVVVRHRADTRWRCEPAQFLEYLEAVERTARFVDQLQPGDPA